MLVRARSAFVSTAIIPAGEVISPADIYEDDNPHVRAYPDCFDPVRATVEQASAAPGEMRTTRRVR